MSSILSNESDSLLQSFDIIRISPSPEDDDKYREELGNSFGPKSSISVDAQSINIITDSMLSNYTPHNSLPSESGAPSLLSASSQESVIINNRNSIRAPEPNSIRAPESNSIRAPESNSIMAPQTNSIRTPELNSITKSTLGPEIQRTSMTNSRTVNGLNDIGPGIIMGNMQVSNITDYSYICGPKSDNFKIAELQARFKNTEEILKRNNIKLRQQYSKLQKFQNEVQEAAELSTKHIEERDREILALKAIINDFEIKIDNLKAQSDWSQENFRVNLNFLETENFEFKKTISEKLAIISNMSAEMKKLQDQNIYLASNSKNPMTTNVTSAAASIPLNEHNGKIKELERKTSSLLAENLELRDLITKFKNEIHAREVHLAQVQETGRYKINEIERVNAELEKEQRKRTELSDHVGVLEIFLADCKSDFERERQERSSLAGNREELLTELKMSQKRNQQLLEELKKYTDANKNKASPPRTTPPKEHGDFQFSPQSSFICPICSRGFSNYTALDHHVQQCLE